MADDSSAPRGGVSKKTLRHVMLAAAVGSALEWYDFFIYGTASALVFGDLFFPKSDVAIGTCRRHAGRLRDLRASASSRGRSAACFFGHFGDRIGRKPMLVATILLVGGGTFVDRPAADLCLDRHLGAAAAAAAAPHPGSSAPAPSTAAPSSSPSSTRPPGKRGLYGGFAPMGVTVGNLMAAGVFYLVSCCRRRTCCRWGWRIPFLHLAAAAGLGVYIRAKVSETPVFTAAREEAPAVEARRRSRRCVAIPAISSCVIGARLAENGLGYLFPVFGLELRHQHAALSREVRHHRAHARPSPRSSASSSSPGCRTRSDGGRSICSARSRLALRVPVLLMTNTSIC